MTDSFEQPPLFEETALIVRPKKGSPRRKGTSWETAIVNYLRANGVPHAERRALGGAKDRGDIAGVPGVVFEAKAAARQNLAGWIDEAEAERKNDNAEIGVVWFKRRGKTSPGAGFVLMTGDQLMALLRAAGYLAPRDTGRDHGI